MGQAGIPILNKVGYSMFWNSMWDNKINYNRSSNEDVFLIKFMDLFLNDGISINTFNIKKYNINKQFFYNKYNLPEKNLNYIILKKLFFKKNKLKIYT